MTPIPKPSAAPDPEALAALLDAADHATRVTWIRSLGGREQKVLFAACAGRAVTVSDLVAGEAEIVRYPGRNGLAVFSRFEKRLYRLDGEVWGYNHNPPLVRLVSGPGHFSAVDHPEVPGEVLFDYRRVPPRSSAGVPPVADNEHGLPALVFGDLVDVVRRVSRHVFVGEATKGVFPRTKPAPWLVRLGAWLPTAPFLVVRTPGGPLAGSTGDDTVRPIGATMFSAERIRELLEERLPDCNAVVLDPGRDGQHFQAEVTSSAFRDKSRVQQHQLVYGALGEHMRSDIHALQLKTYTPDAWPHR